tara:strand:- start:59 stop:556 length:498 start_codon:yes stop_codon:yes gene_type:complete
MSITIQDNFLNKDYFISLSKAIYDAEFPWFVSNIVKDDGLQFVHMAYFHVPTSGIYDEMGELINKLNCYSLIRIKINLLLRTESIVEHNMHVDISQSPSNAKTSILYLGTNNGYTKFESGEVVESVANRLVTFDGNLKHTGTTNSCSELSRLVININWIPQGGNE